MNNLITCLVLSDCPLSVFQLHSFRQTRQNKPLQHFKQIINYFATFLFRPPPHLLTLHKPIFGKLYQLWYCWLENSQSLIWYQTWQILSSHYWNIIDQSRASLLFVQGIDDIMCVMTSVFDLHINGRKCWRKNWRHVLKDSPYFN